MPESSRNERRRSRNGSDDNLLIQNGLSPRRYKGYHEEYIPLKGATVEEIPLPPRKQSCLNMASIGASMGAMILCFWALAATLIGGRQAYIPSTARHTDGKVSSRDFARDASLSAEQLFDENSRYILKDYDTMPPLSNFLPALAGIYGKPLYVFWVNRGQAIASFGVKSKDYPIMEFSSANIAYQTVPLLGFRTFIQGSRRRTSFLTEPFSASQTRHAELMTDTKTAARLPQRTMYVGANEVQIQEIDHVNGLEVNVTYFVLPEEDFGAFSRRITVRNIQSSRLTISMLDGLAKIEPAGGKLFAPLKNFGRTLEATMKVDSPYPDSLEMPFYRLSTQPGDGASIQAQEAGNWVLAVRETGSPPQLLPIVFDASKIFGEDTTLINPVRLHGHAIDSIIGEKQYGLAKTSAAFAALKETSLGAGESLTITTFFGKAEHILDVPVIARRLLEPGFVQYKLKRSREITSQITACIATSTGNPLFDGHVQQMFLDNSLRGGVPTILGDLNDDSRMHMADEDSSLKVFHLFSRQHGDLERDYTDISIESTFFSQGPNNFRDVIQNRRNDISFNPRVGSTTLRQFLAYIQADGYNPLTVEAVAFNIKDFATCSKIATLAVGEADGHRAQREALTSILNSGPFRPGQLFMLMEEQNIELILSRQDFIDMVAAAAATFPLAVYDSGFWADHFTYLVDLIESFLAIYPEWEQEIMYGVKLPYFFSPASVKPRRQKYVLSTTLDGKGKHVRQLDATVDDPEKRAFLSQFIENATNWYDYSADWQHDSRTCIFKSTPIAKLFLLATIKFATRDPYGMGIEYEAGRPGWNDANNGLPGMIGSGMPETFELVVLLRYILSLATKYDGDVEVPIELGELVNAIEDALNRWGGTGIDYKLLGLTVPRDLFHYWNQVSTAREDYRDKLKVTFSGDTKVFDAATVRKIINRWLDELEAGVDRALRFGANSEGTEVTDLVPTYFSYNVTRWKHTGTVNDDGHPLVEPLEMTLNYIPLFLEGPTRMMKTVNSVRAREIYENVRSSPLRDKALDMYTISVNLEGESLDLGREMAFASGWLENQSVWLHMQYKFFLQLLKHKLYDEFFKEMTSGAMLPFMDPRSYGRPLLECSSFLASSAFEDPSVHGRGFLPRLSGCTAEFLDIWVRMMIGSEPFFLGADGELQMQLRPVLPRWLFKETPLQDPTVSFKLFGSMDVTYYHRRGDDDLFGSAPSRYVVGFNDGRSFVIEEGTLSSDLADKIRRVVFVSTIDAYFE